MEGSGEVEGSGEEMAGEPITTTTVGPTTERGGVTGSCDIDLVLILDTSGSLVEEFERQRQFALDAINLASPADYEARINVAIVSFNNRAYLEKPFGIANKQEILDIINNIPHRGGMTSAVQGINEAIREING